MKTKYQDLLVEFIVTFGGSLDLRLWLKLLREELKELKEATTKEEILKELTDCRYVATGAGIFFPQLELVSTEEVDKILKELQEFNSVVDEAFKNFTEEQLHEAFLRVHASNMSKLGEDGKPILREDGKVLKGPNYKPADLSDLF